MIADIMSNKKFQAIIKELFIKCRKLNSSPVFIIQSYFCVPKDVRLNSTQCLIKKINPRKELQNKAINHSAEPYPFLTIDTILPESDPLRFRKNLFPTDKNDRNWSNQNFEQKNYVKWSTV